MPPTTHTSDAELPQTLAKDWSEPLPPDQRRAPGVEYGFPDADPKFGARQEEAQKWILKLWESRQK